MFDNNHKTATSRKENFETKYKNLRIYFYCYPEGPPDRSAYHHELVCLAEGFEKLGIKFHSNQNHWRRSLRENDYLIKNSSDVLPEDCDIVIADSHWITSGGNLPEGFLRKNRKYRTVYLDDSDGQPTFSWTKKARDIDVILRSHFNVKLQNPSNVKPWAFGLSERIIENTRDIPATGDRRKAVLVNFRVRHPLRVRAQKEFFEPLSDVLPVDSAIDSFHPDNLEGLDKSYWEQTGRRHYPRYYQVLTNNLCCACVGGYELPPVFANSTLAQRIWANLTKYFYINSGIISQFDSWRFWESLAAGCMAFHLDLEKYGLILPVMPENWKHYIGLDLENRDQTIRNIRDNLERFPEIAAAGRTWALENYAPVPTAVRFLDTVLEI